MTRVLTLTTPYMTGPDVERLQKTAVGRLTKRGIHASLVYDGEYGPATHQVVCEAADALGVRPITGSARAARRRVAAILRPAIRTPAEILRGRRRVKEIRAASRGLVAALRWARSQIGTSEHPPGSNKGPKITQWQKEVDIPGGGAPWCGAFARAVAKVYGTLLTTETRYCPWIVAHAKAGTGGYLRWTTSPAAAQAALDDGYLVLTVFDFGGPVAAHVGVLLHALKDVVTNVEGNTSSGSNGSQDNGGIVAERNRRMKDVLGFAVVRKPAGVR